MVANWPSDVVRCIHVYVHIGVSTLIKAEPMKYDGHFKLVILSVSENEHFLSYMSIFIGQSSNMGIGIPFKTGDL